MTLGAEREVFGARSVIALVLVGVIAFAGFLTLLGFANDLDHDRHCRANVYSECAIGFAGLYRLLLQQSARFGPPRSAIRRSTATADASRADRTP